MKTNPLANLLPDENAPNASAELNASLSNGADVVAQSVSDPRPAGLTIADENLLRNAGASSDVPVTDAEDEEFKTLEEALRAKELELEREAIRNAAPRHEEWHVTVKGDPLLWAEFCRHNGLKPLHIELSNLETQLMCASSFDPRALINEVIDQNERQLFTIIRVKHEVSRLNEDEKALYWEAHVKFNGPFRTDRKGTSRDLYRTHEQRWYMTRRQVAEFDAQAFAAKATVMARPSRFAEVEYEACVLDTNPALDGGWL